MTSWRVSRSIASIRSTSAASMVASLRAAVLADGAAASGGMAPTSGHRLGGEGFHLEPNSITVLGAQMAAISGLE